MPRSPQRKSAVLILALLLMGAIVGSGIALSTVISDSGQQSQALNNFIEASLIADSGIERGLAVIKVGRQSKTLDATVTEIAQPGTSSSPTVTGNALTTDAITRSVLKPGESVSFDILQFTNGSLVTPSNSTIDIAGTTNGVTTGPTAGRATLDISWLGINSDGEPFYAGRNFLPVDGNSHNINLLSVPYLRDMNGGTFNAGTISLNATRGFRVRITAVDRPELSTLNTTDNAIVDTVYNFSIRNSVGGFPSRIEITSKGTVGQSQSEKKASVLWQLPSSPLFNYVLFTEGDIIPQ